MPPKLQHYLTRCAKAVGLPIGIEGGYFVGAGGFKGEKKDFSILDYNYSPAGQPELWCDWTPTESDEGIEWNRDEKFYQYTKWLEYLIEHFLKPWGYTVSGRVSWQGEEQGDVGVIVVTDNVVTTKKWDPNTPT